MNIKCLLLGHKTSSYAEELNFKDVWKLHKAIESEYKITSIQAFYEACSIRCVRCGYSYKATTDNNWPLIDGIKKKG